MFYSRKLLNRFLPDLEVFNDSDIITACNSIGTEVETVIKHPELDNLVIGRLLTFSKHPDADKLNVCKVEVGNGKVNTIVCGAKNLVEGKNVIVALEGCKLYDGRVIEYKELRGIKSEGMLCAYEELTPYNEAFISKDDSEGIMLFDEGEVGSTNVASLLGLDDTIYQIDVPFANRNDFNGAYALCQELAGYFQIPFKVTPGVFGTGSKMELHIDLDPAACFMYSATLVENIKVEPSTWWLKSLLMNNGMKPINNIVDKLNWITLLTNVASAAYDAERIDNIEVRYAKAGDVLNGLNGSSYNLSANDIVVKSNDNIICLAGIHGDAAYGVNKDTRKIIVEFAKFPHNIIRNTAIKLNISTDASRRFSKPITNYSVDLAASYINDMFKGSLTHETKIKITKPQKQVAIKANFKEMMNIVGIKMKKGLIIQYLKWFGFKYNLLTNKFKVPAWRDDILIHQDLIEELTKALKVNELPELPILFKPNPVKKHGEFYFINRIKHLLVNNYFNECKTLNTTSVNNLNKLNLFDIDAVNISSASMDSRKFLRTNLLNSLLNVYSYNLKYKNNLEPIFEMQKIYSREGKVNENITLITESKIYLDKINNSSITYNCNGLIAIANEIGKIFNQKLNYNICTTKIEFYNNECLEIDLNGRTVGYIGALKNTILEKYSMSNRKIYAMSLNYETLVENFKEKTIKHTSSQTLMPIIKDLTFNHEGTTGLGKALEETSRLSFIKSYEFVSKFSSPEKNTYSIRFYIENKDGITNEEIENYVSEIIVLFEGNGFRI